MDDKVKAGLAVIAVLVAVGLAVMSGIKSQNPPLHVVGHLGGNMQGGAAPVVADGDNPDRHPQGVVDCA